MSVLMNQFTSLYVINKRAFTIAIILLVALFVLAMFVLPNSIAVAGPATSGAGHCSC